MKVYTINARKEKLFSLAVIILAALIILALLPLAFHGVSVFKANRPPKCESDEEAVSYIRELGWETGDTPLSKEEITIPKVFDELYENYAIMQRQNGMRLDRYKGKKCLKRNFSVLNYENEAPDAVIITIITHKGKIVASHMENCNQGGFLIPLKPRHFNA